MKRRVLAAVAGAALLAGCGTGQHAAGPASDGAVTAAPDGGTTLTVFAAASLKDTFTALGKQFESANPGTKVTFNFAGSSDLAQQIVQGAPADVFAAASDATMKAVGDAGQTAAPATPFAKNALQIAVAPGNPKGISAFADLAQPGLKVVVCAKGVPCGDAALKVEAATRIDVKPVSEEPDVKSTLSKVQSGDADAGLVYVTDIAAAKGAVQGIAFPEAAQAVTNYPIAVVKSSKQAALAQKFEALVTGADGQKVLQAAGFQAP
ncbi:molybdate ABC transporter substrate-binding protein [Pseudonocardia sp. CA-107938]|uniref:molybdate ABC transporter substrate-binding protein n=1 Tax=Pseudonocardia sp. CA-107938 TaxID=3240021 RepID=UPI003D8DAFFD